MVSSRFVLPDPLGPPISACGEASASIIARGTPSTKPIGAQSPVRESSSPLFSGGGSSSAKVATRLRHRSCARAIAWQASVTAVRGSGGSGVTVTCGPVIDVVATVTGPSAVSAVCRRTVSSGAPMVIGMSTSTTEIPAARPPRSTRWTWSASASGAPSPTRTATTHGSERVAGLPPPAP